MRGMKTRHRDDFNEITSLGGRSGNWCSTHMHTPIHWCLSLLLEADRRGSKVGGKHSVTKMWEERRPEHTHIKHTIHFSVSIPCLSWLFSPPSMLRQCEEQQRRAFPKKEVEILGQKVKIEFAGVATWSATRHISYMFLPVKAQFSPEAH